MISFWVVLQMWSEMFSEFFRLFHLLILSYYSAHVFKKHATFRFEYILHSLNGVFI